MLSWNQLIAARIPRCETSLLIGDRVRRTARWWMYSALDLLGLAPVGNGKLDSAEMVRLTRPLSMFDRFDVRAAWLVYKCRTPETGAISYIVLEPATVAAQEEADRAVRVAGLLTRVTGQAAHAVVASMKNDIYAQGLADTGRIVWCRVTEDELLLALEHLPR